MYQTFFSLKERPFKLVPNPEYFFLSKSHEEALAHLNYAISQGDGFVEITGEVGTGKTTLCRVFLDGLDDKTEAAYIFNPKLDPQQLLKTINDEFGIRCDADDTKELIDTLNAYLIEKKREGKNVILLIDEAQNLAVNVMEQLRLLSNLETNKFKLLQIILVGQPELGELLDSHELRQLGQRITLSCHLTPLNPKEMRQYIEHRLHIAGRKPSVQFTRSAYGAIYKYSGGTPRLVNIVCDRSLLTAFGRDQKKINAAIVRAATHELAGRAELRRMRWRGSKKTALAVTTCLLIAAGLMFAALYQPRLISVLNFGSSSNPADPAPDRGPAKATLSSETVMQSVSPPVVKTEKIEDPSGLLYMLEGIDPLSSRNLALRAALNLWGIEVQIAPALNSLEDDNAFFKLGAEQNGMSLLRMRCSFDLIRRLNLPAIISLQLPEEADPLFLVIRKMNDPGLTLEVAGDRPAIEIEPDLLAPFCSSRVYVPWKNFLSYRGTIPQSAPRASIIMLKMHLQDIGYDQIKISPEYDEITQQAVKEVQAKYGLEADGIVGSLTKIALYNEKKSLNIPHIQTD